MIGRFTPRGKLRRFLSSQEHLPDGMTKNDAVNPLGVSDEEFKYQVSIWKKRPCGFTAVTTDYLNYSTTPVARAGAVRLYIL